MAQGRRLSRSDEAMIIAADGEGHTQIAIAALLKLSRQTVADCLHAYQDTTKTAIAVLRHEADPMARYAVKAALQKPELAVKILQGIDVLHTNQRDTDRGPAVQIFVGMPNTPIGPSPFTVSLNSQAESLSPPSNRLTFETNAVTDDE